MWWLQRLRRIFFKRGRSWSACRWQQLGPMPDLCIRQIRKQIPAARDELDHMPMFFYQVHLYTPCLTERAPCERRDLLQAAECAWPTPSALKPLTNMIIQFGIPCCQLSLRQTLLKKGARRSNSINEQRSKGTLHVDGKN